MPEYQRKGLALRVAGYYFLALLACLFPAAGEHRLLVAGLMAFLFAPLALFLSLRFEAIRRTGAENYIDLCALVVLIHLLPEVWFEALLVGVVLAQSPVFASQPRSHLFYLAGYLILLPGMLLAALVHGVEGWEMPMAALLVLSPAVLQYARWQTRLRERREEEARRHESLAQIAGGVAHDFNNILTGVVGNAELIEEALEEGHEALEPLADVIHAATRAGLLSRQLLTFSGRQVERFVAFDLAAEIRACEALLRPTLPAGVTVELDIDPVLPDAEGDPNQVQQVLLNLVLNAAEASRPPARVRVRARHDTSGAEPRLVVRVEDEGTGIDERDLQQIFDPFFSTKTRGHGLGLATVRRIVDAHGGTITVRSRLGEGTCFTLTLPCARRERTVVNAMDTESAPLRSHAALIVDDDSTIRVVLDRVLKVQGWNTYAAGNGAEGLERYRAHRDDVDVVLLDLKMPVMDGWSCLSSIREIDPDVPVVIISGYDPAEVEARPEHDDAHLVFVTKPFKRDDILRAVHKVTAAADAA
jgi:signal transduction histidine kinase/CheY-like chemotaxis protein